MPEQNKPLFISNSNMKRFIKTILFFFLPIFAGLIVLECAMRRVPNDYTYKNNWLTENIDRVRIWTFGSSHGLYGISPRYFSKPAFNSAHVSQPLKYDAFIFNKFINNADSLEWIVLPVSYFTLTSNMEDGEEWWRIKNYCIYYDCPYHPWETKYHTEVVGNPLSLYKQIKRVGRYWIKGVDDNSCDSLGLDLGYSKEHRGENWYMDGPQRAKYHTKDLAKSQPIIKENIGYIESIIQTCAEKQVKVLIVTTPVCSTYYDYVDSAQYTLMIETCNSLAAQYNHVQYLNLFKDSRFVEDDFHDSDHLATEGAAKLTKILDEYISKQ